MVTTGKQRNKGICGFMELLCVHHHHSIDENDDAHCAESNNRGDASNGFVAACSIVLRFMYCCIYIGRKMR